jgi:23S rRNA (cytidine1920-2'-O)/16S rRNA (cytidine1409-2'-O)-methyltransferase
MGRGPTRVRVDQLLVDRGLAESRSRAQALVMAGLVFEGERRLDKPGQTVAPDAAIEVRGRDHPWVSRGGLKLDHALDHFSIDVAGRVCLDLGASTGGFTDVLLARGATTVYAVDVGHGQLAWNLRQDDRVVVLEKTNARALDDTLLPRAPEVIVADLSFISLQVALPAALALAAPGAILVALVKPQFEAGPEQVGRGGIVRDPAIHARVCARIRGWLELDMRWPVLGLVESPVQGADGNREFLIAARKPA